MPPPLPRAVNGNSFAALECNRYTNYGNRGTLAAVMSMSVRWPFVYASVLMALGSGGIASADDLSPEQARAFVVDKLFDYTCFDGTTGMVRIFSDGSVVGTIKSGQGETRFTALPEGTIRVDEQSMCAHLAGSPLATCFQVEKLDYRSFRGSLAVLSSAYCDFYQRNPRSDEQD